MVRRICAIVVLAAVFVVTGVFEAQARHHHRHHKFAKITRNYTKVMHHRASGGIVAVETAAGVIRVASSMSDNFKALIADFVAAGYRPGQVHCFATGGHVRHSRHYAGAACDFDQGGGGTAAFMRGRVAAALIAKHGLRNGCSFRDCGHVDDGGRVGHRYARHRHRHYADHSDLPDAHAALLGADRGAGGQLRQRRAIGAGDRG